MVLAHRAWVATQLSTADADMCAAMASAALDAGLLLRDARKRAAFHLCVAVLILNDRFHEARRAIAALHTEALAVGSVPLQTAAATYEAQLSLRSGRVAEAEEHAREALELAAADASTFSTSAAEVLVAALAERGAFEEAHELLGSAGGVIDARARLALADGARTRLALAEGARARLALAEGDFEVAYGYAREAGDNPAAALALAHLGRRDEAVTLAEADLAAAERFGAPLAIARALVARAVAEPDDETRLTVCRSALASLAFDRNGAVLESVRLRLELGSTLARLGRRVEARELLRPALADADAVGASLLADRARRELVATGLRPRRAAVEGAAALTPRQRQIIELAAAGAANRAIAQQLFLSIKTVETHLAAGYRKLGVRTRVDLSAAVAARPRA